MICTANNTLSWCRADQNENLEVSDAGGQSAVIELDLSVG